MDLLSSKTTTMANSHLIYQKAIGVVLGKLVVISLMYLQTTQINLGAIPCRYVYATETPPSQPMIWKAAISKQPRTHPKRHPSPHLGLIALHP